jgi:Cu-Zn family superoxide dismutase
MRRLTLLATTLFLGGVAACGGGETTPSTGPESTTVRLLDAGGVQVGTAVLTAVPLGGSTAAPAPSETAALGAVSGATTGVRFHVTIDNLGPGSHGFRVTRVGRCDPAGFATAGADFNPLGGAGVAAGRFGHVAGALPDVPVGDDGRGSAEFVDDLVTLDRGPANSLRSQRGTALIVDATAGDVAAGRSVAPGPRVACGVISPEAQASPSPSPSPSPTPSATTSVSTTTRTVTVTRGGTPAPVPPTPSTPAPTPTARPTSTPTATPTAPVTTP